MKKVMTICLLIGLSFTTTSFGQILLDADTPATGSLLGTTPLVTSDGTITFFGEIRGIGDPEIIAAGSSGNAFDIIDTESPAIPGQSTAELFFDFDVDSVTFIYGGNSGSILVEARDVGGAVVDSFFQADTWNGQPAGPETLSGAGIRSLYWEDPGNNLAALDNITISASIDADILVSVDIKPGSCPNPFNGKSKGSVPVAIVGTADFDVTTIDPTTIVLSCPCGDVSALDKWEIKDSTQPDDDNTDCFTCFDADDPLNFNCDLDPDIPGDDAYCGDGYLDLIVKFDTQQLAAAIGAAEREACIELLLTGLMKDDPTIIYGSDKVVIKTKIK